MKHPLVDVDLASVNQLARDSIRSLARSAGQPIKHRSPDAFRDVGEHLLEVPCSISAETSPSPFATMKFADADALPPMVPDVSVDVWQLVDWNTSSWLIMADQKSSSAETIPPSIQTEFSGGKTRRTSTVFPDFV